MMLTELTALPGGVLPVAELRDQLRLGTGFADDGVQDGVLEACLRAAISAVEARTGKALVTRSFRLAVLAWRDLARQSLPVAPVSSVGAVRIVDAAASETVIAPERYRLEPDAHRPAVVSAGLVLPSIPVGGRAEIDFEAGFGAAWGDVPAALAHGVMLLAGHYYEHRHEMEGAGAMPPAVEALIAPYRNIRLFAGGR